MLVSVRWLRHDTLCRGYNFFLIVFLFRLFSTWSGLCVNSSCRCIFLSIHENDSIASLFGNWVRKNFSTSICQSITSTSIHVADRKGMECCQVIDRASIYEWQHSRASHESLRNTQLPLRGKGKKPSSLSYRVFAFDNLLLTNMFVRARMSAMQNRQNGTYLVVAPKKKIVVFSPWNIALFRVYNRKKCSRKMRSENWKIN